MRQMTVNPYTMEDEHKPAWHRLQQQLAGHYTSGTKWDPPPRKSPESYDFPQFELPKHENGSPAPRFHSGPSLVDSIGEGIADLSEWMVNHISPLKVVTAWGISLSGIGCKTRLPLSVFGTMLGAGLLYADAAASLWPLSLLTNLSGDYAGIVTLGAGAAVGWALPTMVGLSVLVIAHLTGLAIALTGIAAGLALAYRVLVAMGS